MSKISDNMNKSNLPRRKRLKSKNRLSSAKAWIPSYSGKNIVKGYANWYGVDLICSIKELKMNGVIVSEDYEEQVLSSIITKHSVQQKKEEIANPMKMDEHCKNSDEYFEFIAGYTSGGTPFGIKHTQTQNDSSENMLNGNNRNSNIIVD